MTTSQQTPAESRPLPDPCVTSYETSELVEEKILTINGSSDSNRELKENFTEAKSGDVLARLTEPRAETFAARELIEEGGVFTQTSSPKTSDRNLKERVRACDPREILRRI